MIQKTSNFIFGAPIDFFMGESPIPAPDIQEEVLALEFPVGREPVTERTLRRVLASLCWDDQRAAWAEVRPEADLPG